MSSLTELQREIGDWHRNTFPLCSPLRILEKFQEEAEELIKEANIEEIADCLIVLLALCERTNVDAEKAVRDKFKTVQARDQAKRDEDRRIRQGDQK